MTHPLAALIAGVPRQPSGNSDPHKVYLLEADILAALEAATPPDLVEAGKVLEGVTPGPWMYRPNKYDDWGVVKADDFHLCQVRDPNCYMTEDLNAARAAKIDPWETNARFIAWCREGVPALIALATAQAAQIAEARADYQRESDQHDETAAEAATLRDEVERLRGAVLQKVAECLAGMTYREVSQEARARIKRALDAALEGKA